MILVFLVPDFLCFGFRISEYPVLASGSTHTYSAERGITLTSDEPKQERRGSTATELDLKPGGGGGDGRASRYVLA